MTTTTMMMTTPLGRRLRGLAAAARAPHPLSPPPAPPRRPPPLPRPLQPRIQGPYAHRSTRPSPQRRPRCRPRTPSLGSCDRRPAPAAQALLGPSLLAAAARPQVLEPQAAPLQLQLVRLTISSLAVLGRPTPRRLVQSPRASTSPLTPTPPPPPPPSLSPMAPPAGPAPRPRTPTDLAGTPARPESVPSAPSRPQRGFRRRPAAPPLAPPPPRSVHETTRRARRPPRLGPQLVILTRGCGFGRLFPPPLVCLHVIAASSALPSRGAARRGSLRCDSLRFGWRLLCIGTVAFRV